MDKRIAIIGIGDDGPAGLTAAALARIRKAGVLAGGERHLAFFPDFRGEKMVLKSPLSRCAQALAEATERTSVVVLASGDPLFYGIGSYLVQRLGRERIDILPHVSSVQLAFARMGESWQDAAVISLHGRPIRGLAQALNRVDKAALFTDDTNSPAAIARYLLSFEMTEYEAFVCENLGGDDERCGWYKIEELADREFSPLNIVILKRDPAAASPPVPLGIDDEAFFQRKPDRGLITKREVRVLSLAELALRPGNVMWDIGACTGSVSIEAILRTPDLRVYAIEKNAEDLVHLRANQVKFRTDFVAVHGRAPDHLETFEDPDAVFIGGSGGELPELIQVCAARLRPGGRIVINAATVETLHTAQQTLKDLGFAVSITLVQVARSRPILNLTRFEGMNPVYIVTARRTEEVQGDGC
jgi:precorrin-6Y C5,15-methyltransferase (decarboxylating)